MFAVIDGKLITAKSNIIEGITRKTILEEVKLSLPVIIKNFTLTELMKASEIFLTRSNSEVRGVVEVDGEKTGDGKVGKTTKEILKKYREYILREIS